MSEKEYLFVLIIILTLLMIYAAIRKKHFNWYMKTLRKNLLSPVLLFLIIFLFLSISTLVIKLFLDNFNFSELWKYKSITFFLFKISLSLLLYSVAFKFLRKLPFSRKGSFYSISTIIFLILQLFVLFGINLVFSFFALWPLVFIFLFTIVKKPFLKLFFLVLSTVPIISICVFIFILPSLSAIELLLLSQIRGNLLISIIILPFIMATIRMGMYHPVSGRFFRLFIPTFSVLTMTLLILIIFVSPFNKKNPIPVVYTEKINCVDNTKKIYIDSSAPLLKETEISIKKSFNDKNEKLEWIDVQADGKSFLNREIINISLNSLERAEKVECKFLSNKQITLYESDLPTKKTKNGRELEVFIGKNPRLPIEFSATILCGSDIQLSVIATYPSEKKTIKINDEYFNLEYVKKLTKIVNYE